MDAKVKVNIVDETDADATISTSNAISGLTGNPFFTTPAVTLVLMKSANDDLIAKIATAANGGKDEIRAKNLARDKVNRNYRKEGNYVNTECDGNWEKAESSGFPLVHPRTPGSKPQLGAENTKVGGVILVFCYLNFKKLISRVIQITKTPEDATSWDLVGVTRRQKHKVGNLTRGDTYYIRLANVTDPNVIEFCEPFSIVVD